MCSCSTKRALSLNSNRQGWGRLPVGGVSERELADAAQLASLADETPEGRSVVVLAKERFGIRERELQNGLRYSHTAQRA